MSETRTLPVECDDVEYSACVSAVLAFIAAQEAESVHDDAQSTGAAESSWRSSSRLEAAGLAKGLSGTKKYQRTLWKMFVAFWAVLSMGMGSGAQAKDSAPGENQSKEASDISTAALYYAGKAKPGIGQHIAIKVALVLKAKGVTFDAVDGARIISLGSGATLATMPPQTSWTAALGPSQALSIQQRSNPALEQLARASSSQSLRKVAYTASRIQPLRSDFKLPFGAPAASATADPSKQLPIRSNAGYLIVPGSGGGVDDLVALNGKLYRGCLWVKPVVDASGKAVEPAVNVINILDVEDYLLSVLPSEMPSNWPGEALKAQAVAARSYAIANLGKHGKDGYDVKATVEDQVYSGVSTERESTNRAVAETEGVVLKYGGKVISAFFHSASGGSTELAENVWGRNVPYLKSVPDYDDLSPHFSWSRQFTTDILEKAVGTDIGQILSLMVLSRSGSNRVQDTLVVGSNGTRFLSGDVLRSALKLPSTAFNVGCDENGYTFAGRGFGHGLGLSQWGAKALAEQGYNAAQILTYYYKDVSVEFLTDYPGI